MADAIDALILDLLESVAGGLRPYAEVQNVWRTSCPRLPVWEEANARGYVERLSEDGRAWVRLTSFGQQHLSEHRGLPGAGA